MLRAGALTAWHAFSLLLSSVYLLLIASSCFMLVHAVRAQNLDKRNWVLLSPVLGQLHGELQSAESHVMEGVAPGVESSSPTAAPVEKHVFRGMC